MGSHWNEYLEWLLNDQVEPSGREDEVSDNYMVSNMLEVPGGRLLNAFGHSKFTRKRKLVKGKYG
jgi:hypothetical protein